MYNNVEKHPGLTFNLRSNNSIKIRHAFFFCNIFLPHLIEELPGLAYRFSAYWMFFLNYCNWKIKKIEKMANEISSNIYFGFKGKPKPAYIYYFQLYICISQTPSEFLRANPSPRSAIWVGKFFFLMFFYFF